MGDGLAELALADLRSRRDEVRAQEAAVSYRRRLVQAQLDIVADLDEASGERLEARLASVLADHPSAESGPARSVATVVGDVEEPEALPDDLTTLTAAERASLAERLATTERDLSSRRRELLDELDTLQEELVRRYRDDGVDASALIEGDR